MFHYILSSSSSIDVSIFIYFQHLVQVMREEELVEVVLKVEESVARECGGVWRRHADLLHHMASLTLCLSPTLLLLHLIPRVTERMVSAVSIFQPEIYNSPLFNSCTIVMQLKTSNYIGHMVLICLVLL